MTTYLLGGSDPEWFSIFPPVRMVLLRIISDKEIFFMLGVEHVVVNHPTCFRVQTCIDKNYI